MNRPPDPAQEWATLAASWRDGAVSPSWDVEALRAGVDLATRRLRLLVALEVIATAGIMLVTGSALARRPSPWVMLIVIDTWVILGLVWAFALWSRRGLWRPLGQTTQAYLALARRRAMQRRRSAQFALALLAVQLVAMASAPAPAGSQPEWRPAGRVVVGAAVMLMIAWALWQQRRAVEEIRVLDRWQEASGSGAP